MTLLEYESMSLPYELKAQFPETNEKGCRKKVIGTIHAVYDDGSITCYDTVNATPDKFKLILRPLSDLIKPIEHKGERFVPIVELLRPEFNLDPQKLYYSAINPYAICYEGIHKPVLYLNNMLLPIDKWLKLIELHFDIADLISKGEAIDVNTLPENTYK